MKYGYYPGCSLEKNAAAYHQSVLAVAPSLGMEFEEINDWNCCGATEYISINRTASFALIARNLALAEKQLTPGTQVAAPCSACYLNMRKTDAYMVENEPLAVKVNEALAAGGLFYNPGTVKTRHLLDIIVNDIGYEAVANRVTQPLKGLRVAPYYGCMIVRPLFAKGDEQPFDNPEYPTTLDKLLQALGAEVVDYPMKAHCCGGHMTQISDTTGFEMIYRLVKGAADYNADMIVTLCPMCQLNLDAFQGAMNNHFKTHYQIPVLYFTQMIGLAFGLNATALGIGAELVDARPALSKIGVEVPPEPEAATKKKPAKDALPMPKMPEEE